MGIIDATEGWLFQVALKKAVTLVVKLGVAYIMAIPVQHYLTQFGITVDPAKLQSQSTMAMMVGVEMFHDYLRLKYPELVKF